MTNIKTVLFLSLFTFSLVWCAPVKAAGWLDGYSNRKTITVTGSTAGAVTDYPMRFTMQSGSGTDSGTTLYLDGKVLSSYNDIRFTKADGTTLLSYWIASKDSNLATVWVKFDSLAASPSTSTFYVYYGNPAASTLSNASSLFLFYESFDTNGIADWTTGNENIHINELTNQSADTVKFVSPTSAAKLYSKANCNTSPWDGAGSLISRTMSLPSGNYRINFSVLRDITEFAYETTALEKSQVKVNGGSVFEEQSTCEGIECSVTGSWTQKSATVLNGTINSLTLEGYSDDCTEGTAWYDDVFIQNYISPEPAVSIAGSDSAVVTSTTTSSPPDQAASTPQCGDAKPTGVPDLFQINTTATTATLYFTPVLDANKYAALYGFTSGDDRFGTVWDQASSTGVLSYQIKNLAPNTIYYFKVAAGNGCAGGNWSNPLKITTPSLLRNTLPRIFYKPFTRT